MDKRMDLRAYIVETNFSLSSLNSFYLSYSTFRKYLYILQFQILSCPCFTNNYLGLQSIIRNVADNVSHPRRLDPTMELITYSFVLYLQHDLHDVKCKP